MSSPENLFKDKLDFAYFNGAFIEQNKLCKVIDLYRELFNGKDSKELYDKLKEIESNINSGFLKESSILLKGVNNG